MIALDRVRADGVLERTGLVRHDECAEHASAWRDRGGRAVGRRNGGAAQREAGSTRVGRHGAAGAGRADVGVRGHRHVGRQIVGQAHAGHRHSGIVLHGDDQLDRCTHLDGIGRVEHLGDFGIRHHMQSGFARIGIGHALVSLHTVGGNGVQVVAIGTCGHVHFQHARSARSQRRARHGDLVGNGVQQDLAIGAGGRGIRRSGKAQARRQLVGEGHALEHHGIDHRRIERADHGHLQTRDRVGLDEGRLEALGDAQALQRRQRGRCGLRIGVAALAGHGLGRDGVGQVQERDRGHLHEHLALAVRRQVGTRDGDRTIAGRCRNRCTAASGGGIRRRIDLDALRERVGERHAFDGHIAFIHHVDGQDGGLVARHHQRIEVLAQRETSRLVAQRCRGDLCVVGTFSAGDLVGCNGVGPGTVAGCEHIERQGTAGTRIQIHAIQTHARGAGVCRQHRSAAAGGGCIGRIGHDQTTGQTVVIHRHIGQLTVGGVAHGDRRTRHAASGNAGRIEGLGGRQTRGDRQIGAAVGRDGAHVGREIRWLDRVRVGSRARGLARHLDSNHARCVFRRVRTCWHRGTAQHHLGVLRIGLQRTTGTSGCCLWVGGQFQTGGQIEER